MRLRALSSTGDYTFGKGLANLLIDNPAVVGLKVKTRLGLILGEWYLDTSQGTPWLTEVFGYNTQSVRDLAVKNIILSTEGVTALESFSSNLNPTTRLYSIIAEIITVYGTTTIATNATVI